MDSLYDVKDYSDIAKPSDSMGEDDYLQDVFFTTRPDIFDKKDNPYYINYNEQNDTNDQEKSDFKYNFNPHQYDKQNAPLVNPYKKIKDIRSSVSNVIAEYRLENEPLVFDYPQSRAFEAMTNNSERGYSFFDLLTETSNFSKNHAPKCTVTKTREHVDKRTWTFNVKGHKEDSFAGGHSVFIRLGKDPKERNIQKLKVNVSCSCPFWKWWGPDYNARTEKYLETGPGAIPLSNGSPPDIRDKGRHNKICKHVYAVGKIFDRFAKSHDLDTYEDVYTIIKDLDKSIDPKKMKDISALLDILLLDRSEIKKLDPLVLKYKKDKNPLNRKRIKQDVLKNIEEILQNKDKGVLKKIQTGLSDLPKSPLMFKKSSSVDNVLEMYINHSATGDI